MHSQDHTSGSGNSHHRVLGTLGQGIPVASRAGWPRLLLPLAVLGASKQHRSGHAARARAGVLLGGPGAHQGYQRLREERSGSACPSCEGSGMSLTPKASRTHIRQQNSCSEQSPTRPIPGGQERAEQNPPRRSQSCADARSGGSPAGHGERRFPAEMLSTAPGSGCGRNPGEFTALGWETPAPALSRVWEGSPCARCLPPGTRDSSKAGSSVSLPPRSSSSSFPAELLCPVLGTQKCEGQGHGQGSNRSLGRMRA